MQLTLNAIGGNVVAKGGGCAYNTASHEVNKENSAHTSVEANRSNIGKISADVAVAAGASITGNINSTGDGSPANRVLTQSAMKRGSEISPSQRVESAGASSLVTPNASLTSSGQPYGGFSSAGAFVDSDVNCTSRQAPSSLAEGRQRAASPPLNSNLGLTPSHRSSQRTDFTTKSDTTTATVATGAAASVKAATRVSGSTLKQTLQLLGVNDVNVTALAPQQQQQKIRRGASKSLTTSSLSTFIPSFAADTAPKQITRSPHIFNRDGHTQVISVHSTSSSNFNSSVVDSVTIHFNMHEPPVLCALPPHPSDRVGESITKETLAPATAPVSVAGGASETSTAGASPVTPGPGVCSEHVSRRSFPDPRTATNSLDSQPPTLTDMTHAPGSQFDSSWDNSLTGTTDSSGGSGHKNENGGGITGGKQSAAALKELRDAAKTSTTMFTIKQSAPSAAEPTSNLTLPSSLSGSSLTHRVRCGEGHRKRTQLLRPTDGIGSSASASSARSVKTAVFHDHNSTANIDVTTKAISKVVRAGPGTPAPQPLNKTTATSSVAPTTTQARESRRTAPAVYRRRLATPSATTTEATTPAPASAAVGNGEEEQVDGVISMSPDHADVEVLGTLKIRLSPQCTSSSTARPSSNCRVSLAQPNGNNKNTNDKNTTNNTEQQPSWNTPAQTQASPAAALEVEAAAAAASSRLQSNGVVSPLPDTSAYPKASEGSPSSLSPPPQQQQQQLGPEHLQQLPPTTRAPMSLSASCPSHEALLSLSNFASIVCKKERCGSVTVHEAVTAGVVVSASPVPGPALAAHNSSSSSFPVVSAHPTTSSILSVHPSADGLNKNNSNGISGATAAAGNVTETTTKNAIDNFFSHPETDETKTSMATEALPGPVAVPDLTRLGESPSLPHAAQQLTESSGYKGTSQYSQLNRDREVSVPRLATLLTPLTMHAGYMDPLFASPPSAALMADGASGSTSDYACRHPAQFTAAPQLVPEASQEFFVRGVQRMDSNSSSNSASGGYENTKKGAGNRTVGVLAAGPPTARGNAPVTSVPKPLGEYKVAAPQPAAAVARQILLDDDKNNSASGDRFDIRSTSSAPHPLMTLVLDARRLPMSTPAEEGKAMEERLVTGTNAESVDSRRSDRSSGCNGSSSKKTFSALASVKEDRVPLSPTHSVDDDGNIIIYWPSPSADEAGEKRVCQKAADTLSISRSSNTAAVLPPRTTQASASPTFGDASAYCALTATVTNNVNNTISSNSNGNCDNRNVSTNGDSHHLQRQLNRDVRGASYALAAVAPGEVTLTATHTFPSPTSLATDLVPDITARPSSADMSDWWVSSNRAHSPQLTSHRQQQKQLLPRQKRQSQHQKSDSGSTDKHFQLLTSSPVSHARVLLASDRYRDRSLSTPSISHVIRLAAAPPPAAPGKPPLTDTTATATSTNPTTSTNANTTPVPAVLVAASALEDLQMSFSQPSTVRISTGISGHSTALISEATSSEWSASLPPPPPAPPLRFYDMHTQVQQQQHQPRQDNISQQNKPPAVKKSGLCTSPAADGTQGVASVAAPAALSARVVRTMLRSRSEKATDNRRKKPPQRQLPPPVPARHVATKKLHARPPEAASPADPQQHTPARSEEETREASKRQPHQPPWHGQHASEARDIAEAAPASAAPPAAVVPVNERGSSLSSGSAASTSTASLMNPPHTVEPSHSLHRQPSIAAKSVILAEAVNSAGQRGKMSTDASLATEETLPHTVPVAEAMNPQAVAQPLSQAPCRKISFLTIVASSEPSPVAGSTAQDDVKERSCENAPTSPPCILEGSASPFYTNRRLTVRRMPTGEPTTRSARTAPVLPMDAATASAAIPSTPVKVLSSPRNSPVRVPPAAAVGGPLPPLAAVPSISFADPSRELKAVTARSSMLPVSTPRCEETTAAPQAFTTRDSPLRRGREHSTSLRAEELPLSSLSSRVASPHPTTLENDSLLPQALSVCHVQSVPYVTATINTATATVADPHHETLSPPLRSSASLAIPNGPRQGTVQSIIAPSTSAPAAASVPTGTTPTLSPAQGCAATAVEQLHNVAAASGASLTAAVLKVGRRLQPGAVAASPYARMPTYNNLQKVNTGDATAVAAAVEGAVPSMNGGERVHLKPEAEVDEREEEQPLLATPAARSPPRRATRMTSKSNAKRTPLHSGTAWVALEAQVVNTPGTDFASSIIPATAETADSRGSPSPETSVLMHALGDWTPVRQPAREQPAREQPAREQPAREQPAREQPAAENTPGEAEEAQAAVLLATPAAMGAVEGEAVSPPRQPQLTRCSKRQMRYNRAATTAPWQLPASVPRASTHQPSSSPLLVTRNQSELQQQRQLKQQGSVSAVPPRAELESHRGVPPPPAVTATSKALSLSPPPLQQEQHEQQRRSSSTPQRKTVATSPPNRCHPSPSASKIESGVRSAYPAAHMQPGHADTFVEPEMPTQEEKHPQSQPTLRTSVSSQTDPVLMPRAVLVPSSHRHSDTSHTPRGEYLAPLPSPPRHFTSSLDIVVPSRLVSLACQQVPSSSSIPAPARQQPPLQPQTLVSNAQPAHQPSPNVTPKHRLAAELNASNFFATPPTKFFGLVSPVPSLSAHDGEVVREALPDATRTIEMNSSSRLDSSPVASSQRSNLSVPSNCLRVHQRQAGTRSRLPRTLTPESTANTAVPAVLPQNLSSIETAQRDDRESSRCCSNNSNGRCNGGVAFGKLGALGQKLIPLWWRKGHRTESSNNSSNGHELSPAETPLVTATKVLQQPQQPVPRSSQLQQNSRPRANYADYSNVVPPRHTPLKDPLPCTLYDITPQVPQRHLSNFMYAVEPTPDVHVGTDYYNDHPLPEQQLQRSKALEHLHSLVPPSPVKPVTPGESEAPQTPSPFPATPPGLKLHTQASVSAGVRRTSSGATSGQRLQSLSLNSAVAAAADTGTAVSTSGGSVPSSAGITRGGGEKPNNYYGAYQRSLHPSCKPASSSSPSPLTGSTTPLAQQRPTNQRQQWLYRSELPYALAQNDVPASNSEDPVAGNPDIRAPRLTRALLETFQRAQAAKSTSPTPATLPRQQQFQLQQQSQLNDAASPAYFANPRYEEQQARAQAKHRTTGFTDGIQVEEITPVLSAPSRGRGRPNSSPPHPGDFAHQYPHFNANMRLDNTKAQRATAASLVPPAARRAASPAAVPPAATGALNRSLLCQRTSYSPSPVPVAPQCCTDVGTRQQAPVYNLREYSPRRNSATTGVKAAAGIKDVTLPDVGRTTGRRSRYPAQRYVLPLNPQPRTTARPAATVTDTPNTATAACHLSARSEGVGQQPVKAVPVTPPFLPQLRPSSQANRATVVAGAALAVPSTPKSSSVPIFHSREEVDCGHARRTGSLLRGIRVLKEQRTGRRAGLS